MRLHLSLLEKFITLPDTDPAVLRHISDDLGLEVKSIESGKTLSVLVLETLAHRGDHLSVIGIAREFSARYLSAIKYPAVVPELNDARLSLMVRKYSEDCLRYALMEMSVPENMQLRKDLEEYIENPDPEKHALVHILNYVQMELGQPMHAFDRSKVEGEIQIVNSEVEETVEALDGKTYKVPAGAILIRDRKKTLAVAGVIGCKNSMITPGCTRVLIESATFDPVSVRKTARAMGVSTDSSYLFERGADTDMVDYALKRVLHLASGGAGLVKSNDVAHDLGFVDVATGIPALPSLTIQLKRFKTAMNLPRLNDVEIVSRLKYQGYNVELTQDKKSITVKVPSWRRWSVQSAATVIEDFARAHGLNAAKPTLPPLDYEQPEPDSIDVILERIEPVLTGNGFLEVVTRSYYGAADATLIQDLDPSTEERQVTLNNSLDRGYSHLKQTNIIHAARALENYLRRGGEGARIFEVGQLFASPPPVESNFEHEHTVYSLAAAGRWNDAIWKKEEPLEEQVARFRGVIVSMFQSLGADLRFTKSEHPFLHPGRQAAMMVGKIVCGFVGTLHPKIVHALDLSREVHFAELYHMPLLNVLGDHMLQEVTDFPAVRRDVTFKVSGRAFAGDIQSRIAGMKEEFLTDVAIVDEFRKQEEEFRRVTFRLTFQSAERTLEHSEVDSSMETIISRLKERDRLEMV